MDKKQKIMRLIIDNLLENEQIEYRYTGSAVTMDPDIVSLEFTARNENSHGEFNIWGTIIGTLQLKAQYDSRSMLTDNPQIQQLIQDDLDRIAVKINRLI